MWTYVQHGLPKVKENTNMQGDNVFQISIIMDKI